MKQVALQDRPKTHHFVPHILAAHMAVQQSGRDWRLLFPGHLKKPQIRH